MPRPKTQRTPKEPKPMGRPLLTGERLATNLQVRVPPKLAETCKELGGANFLRPLIENAAKHAVALKNLKASRPTQDEADGIKFLDMAVQCGLPLARRGLRRKRFIAHGLLREKPGCNAHYRSQRRLHDRCRHLRGRYPDD